MSTGEENGHGMFSYKLFGTKLNFLFQIKFAYRTAKKKQTNNRIV